LSVPLFTVSDNQLGIFKLN